MGEELDNETEPTNVDAEALSEAGDSSQAKLQEENGFLLDQLQRARAELANFRRRTVDQQAQRERRITSEVFQQVIPLMDDLHMAVEADTEHAPPEDALARLREGLALIEDKFASILSQFGIDTIPSVGEDFDPNWHEAMLQQTTDEYPDGRIISEFVRGFRMGDDLIRAARVIVAKAPIEGVESN